MSGKRKVLIIENQFSQFEKIFENLGSEYEKIPAVKSQSDFIMFINSVRVWVNEQYPGNYRDKAFENLMEIIDNGIQLILMDHILGGAHHCKTGIDLALEINRKRAGNKKDIIPILFLSKTRLDDKKRETGIGKLKGINHYAKEYGLENFKWVHKGYFGDEILNSYYFTEAVLPMILELFGDSEMDKITKAIDMILLCDFPNNQEFKKVKLTKIKDEGNFQNLSSELKSNILEVAKSKLVHDLNIIENE